MPDPMASRPSPIASSTSPGADGRPLRIIYLTAGAATRFCGSCLHDNALARALTAAGEDILLVPNYTPLRTDEENVSLKRVFFGGVNVYLQQHSALFRHTPWFVDRLLDSPKLLDWLARRSAGMDVPQLGGLTVSTLQGEHGRQRKELEKLIRWLETGPRPDLIHLSNALLLGMAPALKKRLQVPIVCGLAGEDLFLEQLTDPHYSQSRQLLRQLAGEVDAFVAYNQYFADFMASYLDIDPQRIEVIHHGLNLDGHAMRAGTPANSPFTIGFFGRIAPEKGLHLFVEAAAILAADSQLPPLRFTAAGYKSSGDEPYYQTICQRIKELNLQDRFHYSGELDRAAKIQFLQSLDVMSVPTVYHESKGLALLEAMASGVPVVAPRHGAFPEMIELTGGGLLCDPASPADLADKLRQYISNPQLVAEHGSRGRAAIQTHFTADHMAAEHRRFYRQLLASAKSR